MKKSKTPITLPVAFIVISNYRGINYQLLRELVRYEHNEPIPGDEYTAWETVRIAVSECGLQAKIERIGDTFYIAVSHDGFGQR